MMRTAVVAILGALLLCACQGTTVSPRYADAPVVMTQVADAQGWYKFGAMQFKGTLRNGMPDGFGTCRTYYSGVFTESPCEFRNAERVDALHQERMREVASDIKRRQDQEEQARQDAADRHRRESEEAYRASNETMRAGYLGLQQNLARQASEDAARTQQFQEAQNAAMERRKAQAQADAEEAERRRKFAEQDRLARQAASATPTPTVPRTSPTTPAVTVAAASTASATTRNSSSAPLTLSPQAAKAPAQAPTPNQTIAGKEQRNAGASKMLRHGCLQGFNDGGIQEETLSKEAIIAKELAQLQTKAKEWVAGLGGGTGSAKFTGITLERCIAMGGNPHYQRCHVTVKYDYESDLSNYSRQEVDTILRKDAEDCQPRKWVE